MEEHIRCVFGDLVSEGGGCSIPDTAWRGITVGQLERIVEHVTRRFESGEVWTVKRPNYPGAVWPDFHDEDITSVEDVNLYDLDLKVIRPATEAKECSLVSTVCPAL